MARINYRSGAGAGSSKRKGSRRGKKDAALITDARGSRIRNYDHRRHTYAALQWSRVPLLLLSGAFYMWWDLPWLAAIFMIISVPMPWIAVVIANGVGEPEDKRHPRVYKPAIVREQNRRWEEEQRKLALREAERRAIGAVTDSEQPAQPEQPAPRTDAAADADEGPIIIDMPEDDDPSSSPRA